MRAEMRMLEQRVAMLERDVAVLRQHVGDLAGKVAALMAATLPNGVPAQEGSGDGDDSAAT